MNTLFQGVQWIAPTDLGVSQFCLKVGQTTWFAQLFHVSLFCRKAAMTDGDYQKQLLPDRIGQKTWWPHTMCGATRLDVYKRQVVSSAIRRETARTSGAAVPWK